MILKLGRRADFVTLIKIIVHLIVQIAKGVKIWLKVYNMTLLGASTNCYAVLVVSNSTAPRKQVLSLKSILEF